MLRSRKALGLFLLVVTTACGRDAGREADAVHRALAVSAEVAAANEADVRALVALVRSRGGSRPLDASLREVVVRRLRSDREGYAELAGELGRRWQVHLRSEGEEERARTRARAGSPALRSGLAHLAGSGEVQPGLLEEAATLLEQTRPGEDWPSRLSVHASDSAHAFTVAKVALLYAIVLLDDASDRQEQQDLADLTSRVHLLYPARIPDDLDTAQVRRLGLVCDLPLAGLHLLIPNAGYVFGGQVRDGEIRGVDCGTFVSHVLGSETTWWTGGLEAVAKELRVPSGEARDVDWMRSGLAEFDLVRRDRGEDLLPGDVVVWRWTSERGQRVGHVVLAVDRVGDDGRFRAVDARRDDDGREEGIAVRQYVLEVPGRDVYVLRPR